MPIVNFHITGSADRLQMTLTVKDNLSGRLVPGSKAYKCDLKPLPQRLRDKYRLWQQRYTTWVQGGATTLTPASPPIEIETNISVLQECQQIGNELISEFNEWIKHTQSIQTDLSQIVSSRDYCRNPSDFCFILNADTIDPELNLTLQRLPFHTWDFIQRYYPHAEISLSTTHHALAPVIRQARLQVLVILGYDAQTNLVAQQIAIGKQLADSNLADVTYWNQGHEPDAIASLYRTLNTSSPQVLFFVGHSESTNGVIRIHLNDAEFISPQDSALRNILTKLKNRGLIFAAFISCDGIGIAQELSDLGIPYLMVSREILPVHVAKKFLDEFLKKATEPGVPIHIALSHARQHLQETVETRSTNDGCPNASTFPVIFQIPEQHSYILNPILEPEVRSIWATLFDRIKSIINLFAHRRWKLLCLFSFAVVASSLIWIFPLNRPTACDLKSSGLVFLTCGEKSILGDYELDNQALQGMKYFAEGNYNQAIGNLEAAWENNKKNPELLIALNNARVKNQNSIPIKTIAVLIPFNEIIEKYLPVSLLSAVAEAQEKWNKERRNHDDWLLQVTIGNDYNDPRKASNETVVEILKRTDILGTIGPYSSYVSEGIVGKFIDNKHTLISGTNTSTNLSKKTPYFFRTVNSNNIQVEHTINYLLKQKINKVELLRGNRAFSKTFAKSMQERANNMIKIHEIQIANIHLNPQKDVLQQAKQNGSQALILVPDAFITNDKDSENVRQIIINNNGNMPIVGNEVVNDPWLIDTMEKQPEIARNLTLSLTWDASVDRTHISSAFITAPKWWDDSSHQISHRTVLTYDATQVLIAAIDQGVKKGLKNSDIKENLPQIIRQLNLTGMTGSITFSNNSSDRQEQLNGFVRPKMGANGKFQGYEKAE
jgi:branched-chain amino acid transport system substrate-binding protein